MINKNLIDYPAENMRNSVASPLTFNDGIQFEFYRGKLKPPFRRFKYLDIMKTKRAKNES